MKSAKETNHHQNGSAAALNGQSSALSIPPNQAADADASVTFWGYRFELLDPIGYELAESSDAFRENEADVAAIHRHTWANAQLTFRQGRYDPVNNPDDKESQREADKNFEALQEADDQLLRYEAIKREQEESGVPIAKPALSPLWKIVGVAALTVTTALTLHDCFFSSLNDDITAWVFSVLFSLPVGLLITLTILSESNISDQSTAHNRLSLVSGLALGLALFLMRIYLADIRSGLWLAVGMALFEVAVVIGLKLVAEDHRKDLAAWRPYDANNARIEHTRQEIQKRCNDHARHIDYVRMRNCRANLQDPSELEEALRQLELARYHRRISENLGRVRGVRSKSKKEKQ